MSHWKQVHCVPKKRPPCYFSNNSLKMSPHYLVKCTAFSSDWRYVAFLQTLVALIKAGCGLALVALKRTGCDVWWTECQTSNVTANVQSDHLLHGYMLPVFFATDQLYGPPRSAEIQPMSQQDVSATHLYHRLGLDTCEKMLTKQNWDTVYIIVHPKAGCTSLICCSQQHYQCQWLPNTEWSHSGIWAPARDRWLWRERLWEKEGFKTRVENAMRKVSNRSRSRAWRWRRAGWWWCARVALTIRAAGRLIFLIVD